MIHDLRSLRTIRRAHPRVGLLLPILVLMLGIALAGLPSAALAQGTAGGQGQTVVVHISNFSFGNPLTVMPGTSVQWINDDTVAHTVTADDGSFDSGSLPQGGTFSFTFSQEGDFAYYCRFHGGPGGQGMSSKVTVSAQAGNAPAAPAAPAPAAPGTGGMPMPGMQAPGYGNNQAPSYGNNYKAPGYGNTYKAPSYNYSYRAPVYKAPAYSYNYRAPSYNYKAPSYSYSYRAPVYKAPRYSYSYRAPSYSSRYATPYCQSYAQPRYPTSRPYGGSAYSSYMNMPYGRGMGQRYGY